MKAPCGPEPIIIYWLGAFLSCRYRNSRVVSPTPISCQELMWSAGVELLKPLPASGTLSQRGSPGVQVRKSSNGVSAPPRLRRISLLRSEEHTSELTSLMSISYAVFCLNKKKRELSYTQNREL